MIEKHIPVMQLMNKIKRRYGESVIYNTVSDVVKECNTVELHTDNNNYCNYCDDIPNGEFYTINGNCYCKDCIEKEMTYEELEKEFNFGREEIINYLLKAEEQKND